MQDMSCQEKAQRNIDDVLILRFFLLLAFAVDSNRVQGLSDPACVVEHPCAEDDLAPEGHSSDGRSAQVSPLDYTRVESHRGTVWAASVQVLSGSHRTQQAEAYVFRNQPGTRSGFSELLCSARDG